MAQFRKTFKYNDKLTLVNSQCISTTGLFPSEKLHMGVACPASHTKHCEVASTDARRRMLGEARLL